MRWQEHEREARRNVVEWVLLIGLMLVAIAYVAEGRLKEAEPPEVSLEPVVVEMDDPFPCSNDPMYRVAYQRLGAVCAGGDR